MPTRRPTTTSLPDFPHIGISSPLYLVVLELSPVLNAVILLALSALVFVRIGYIYPTRTTTARALTLRLDRVWSLMMLVLILQLPTPPAMAGVDCRYSSLCITPRCHWSCMPGVKVLLVVIDAASPRVMCPGGPHGPAAESEAPRRLGLDARALGHDLPVDHARRHLVYRHRRISRGAWHRRGVVVRRGKRRRVLRR